MNSMKPNSNDRGFRQVFAKGTAFHRLLTYLTGHQDLMLYTAILVQSAIVLYQGIESQMQHRTESTNSDIIYGTLLLSIGLINYACSLFKMRLRQIFSVGVSEVTALINFTFLNALLFESLLNDIEGRVWIVIIICFLGNTREIGACGCNPSQHALAKVLILLYFVSRYFLFLLYPSYWHLLSTISVVALILVHDLGGAMRDGGSGLGGGSSPGPSPEKKSSRSINAMKQQDANAVKQKQRESGEGGEQNKAKSHNSIAQEGDMAQIYEQLSELLKGNTNFFENIKDMISLGMALFDSHSQAIFCNSQILKEVKAKDPQQLPYTLQNINTLENNPAVFQEGYGGVQVDHQQQQTLAAVMMPEEAPHNHKPLIREGEGLGVGGGSGGGSQLNCSSNQYVSERQLVINNQLLNQQCYGEGATQQQPMQIQVHQEPEKESSNNLINLDFSSHNALQKKLQQQQSLSQCQQQQQFHKSVSCVAQQIQQNKINIINIQRQQIQLSQSVQTMFKNPANSVFQVMQMLFKHCGQSQQALSIMSFQQVESGLDVLQPSTRVINSCTLLDEDSIHILEHEIIVNKKLGSRVLQFRLSICIYHYLNVGCAPVVVQQDQAVFMTCQDITKDLEAQQFNQMNSFKMRIIASISHKLRTPLNCSMNMLQALSQNAQLPADAMKCVLPALSSNLLLNSCINDICDYAALEMNKFSLELSTFPLEQTISECINLFRDQLDSKGLTVRLVCDKELPRSIISDQKRLRQIIINLLGNAIKFQEKGEIVISAKNHSDDLVKLQVIDQGIGMNYAQVESIFKAWNTLRLKNMDLSQIRGKHSLFPLSLLSLDLTGAGLGLTIAAKLVNKLSQNRKIRLESQANHGTTFKFYVKNMAFLQRKSVTQLDSQKQASSNSQEQIWSFHSLMHDCLMSNSKLQILKPSPQSQPMTSQFGISCNIDSQMDEEDKDRKTQVQPPAQSQYRFPKNFNPEQLFYGSLSNNSSYKDDQIKQDLDLVLSNNESVRPQLPSSIKKKKKWNSNNSSCSYSGTASFGGGANQNNGSLCGFQSTVAMVSGSACVNSSINVNASAITAVSNCSAVSCKCPKILLVDDEMYNIKVMKVLLQSLPYAIDSAESGQKAIDLVKKMYEESTCCHTYKLIFMDIDMNDKNGFQTTREILKFFDDKLGPSTDQFQRPYICACTAYLGEEDKLLAKQVGMKHYLQKPVEKDKLFDFLKTVL